MYIYEWQVYALVWDMIDQEVWHVWDMSVMWYYCIILIELYYVNSVFIGFYVVLLYHYDNIVLVEFFGAEKIYISCRTLLDSQKTCQVFLLDRSHD